MSEQDEALGVLVEAIAGSAKYKYVSDDLVRAIGERELAKGLSTKAAIKATKSKLHQVAGAYQPGRIDYDGALSMLRAAGSPAAWAETCRAVMGLHASTRERLPILDSFYMTLLAGLPEPRSVLDIACGLNPLARGWMPLADTVAYWAYDVYQDMIAFLQAYMDLAGIDGRAAVRDVLHDPPRERVDLALLLKTLPCLEQVQKGAAARLVDAINARYLVVSYPIASLGGRQKGMVATYEAQFAALAEGRGWRSQRFLFDSELAFLVHTER